MRNPLSDKVVQMKPSGIRKFFDIVNEMEGAISLGVGEPDFDTPWHIREEGIYSLEKGRTFYTSNAGLKQLKDEICNYLKRRFEVSYDPDTEIMVTVGGSEAIDVAMRAMLNPGDEVLIPQPSYVSYEPCTVLADGVPVFINLKEENQFRLTAQELRDAITDKTILISVMMVNNEIGTVQPIKEIAKIAKAHKILFHTDAVQAIGHVPVNVQEMNIDMLSCSAHKFHGPRGVGFLYARRGIPLTNIIEGGAQERGKRGGTENTPAIAGMTAALREAVDHMDENMRKVTRLRETLITGLETIAHARLNGDRTQRVPGTVNFCFEGIEGESLLLLLDRKGIAASSGSACTSGSLDPSHVLLALGLPHEVAHGSLRLSVGEYNADEEMAYIVENVRQVVDYLRSISPVWDELETGVRPHQI